MIPAPIVPIPAIKNGIETCNVVSHHFSTLSTPCPGTGLSSSSPPPPITPLAWSDPGSGSEDATDVVIIELNEPVVDEGCSTDNLSFSSANKKKITKYNYCYKWHIFLKKYKKICNWPLK